VADAGNLEESTLGLAGCAALAMKGDCETMGFVADLLNEVQNRGVAIQGDGVVFLAENVEDFFLLGDAGQGLVDDLQGFQGLRRGVSWPRPPSMRMSPGKGFFSSCKRR